MEKVILASRNKGKLKEIQAILEKFGMETISRDDAGIPEFEVEETGTTSKKTLFSRHRQSWMRPILSPLRMTAGWKWMRWRVLPEFIPPVLRGRTALSKTTIESF